MAQKPDTSYNSKSCIIPYHNKVSSLWVGQLFVKQNHDKTDGSRGRGRLDCFETSMKYDARISEIAHLSGMPDNEVLMNKPSATVKNILS